MNLSIEQSAAYDRDGYLLLDDIFSAREVAAMRREIEGGERVTNTVKAERADASGKAAKLALWNDIGDDIWGAASSHPHIVNTVRMLLREEVGFFHGKVMLKEAHSGGAWEWHQDYGYWYVALAFPRLMSAFVAVDEATRENGCLQVLRGSHKLGRLEHDKVGGQTGADPKRIAELLPYFELVHCEMKPGSVLFFDCNLLHSSSPNESDTHRRSFITCYNAVSNPHFKPDGTLREYTPCPTGGANALDRFVD